MKNTAIFVDYDNVFITLERFYKRYGRLNLPEKILPTLTALFTPDHNIIDFKAYLDFNTISLSSDAFEEFKHNFVDLRHVYSGDNASDVTLIIDIIKTLYDSTNEIEKYIIVSSDSDMMPVISELRRRNKEVKVIYFGYNTNEDYVEYLTTTNYGYEKTIEEILGLNVYVENDFRQFTDSSSIKIILDFINSAINETYDTYKRVESGKIITAGTLNKKALREYLEKHSIFVKQDIISGFAIDTLFNRGILYEYPVPGSTYRAILLNEDYISRHGIVLDNPTIKKEADYHFPLNV